VPSTFHLLYLFLLFLSTLNKFKTNKFVGNFHRLKSKVKQLHLQGKITPVVRYDLWKHFYFLKKQFSSWFKVSLLFFGWRSRLPFERVTSPSQKGHKDLYPGFLFVFEFSWLVCSDGCLSLSLLGSKHWLRLSTVKAWWYSWEQSSLFAEAKKTHTKTRWWFRILFIFTPNLGEMIQFDEHSFQMGWNHQLEDVQSFVFPRSKFKGQVHRWFFCCKIQDSSNKKHGNGRIPPQQI